MKKIKARNQFSDRPPFCDFLERFQAAHKDRWKKSNFQTARVGLGRFDEWIKVTDYRLTDLNWQNLLEFYRFLAKQGISASACSRSVQVAKHALRWGIEQGELSQKMEDLYTFHYCKNKWEIELPALSLEFLSAIEPTRPGAYTHHRYAHRIFHTFLREKNLTYRKLKQKHFIIFVKYLDAKGFKQRSRMFFPMRIRMYLHWLYDKRKIKRHPNDLLPSHLIPKKVMSLPRPLDPEIDQRLQQILQDTNDIYYKSILLIRRTGLRITELRKLEFDCIQFDPKNRASLRVPPVKLGIERRVPLDPETTALINEIQVMSLKNYKKKMRPRFLVIGPLGTPPRYERYSAAMTEICARLGVRKWINLHSLRHTYATSMLNAGLSIISLKEILGHKTITMSLLYARVSQEKVHAEYSEAIAQMSKKHIPKILQTKPGGVTTAFSDLNAFITKAIDACSELEERKQLQRLLNRLAKIKMELLSAQA